MPSSPLYALRRSEVFEALETCPEGLSAVEAGQRVDLYGYNILEEARALPAWRRLLHYMIHPMALLLWLAGGHALGAAWEQIVTFRSQVYLATYRRK